MADDGNPEHTDVRSQEIFAGIEKTREVHKTLRLFGILGCSLIGIGIIAWAVVEINSKPGWLTLALAVLTPGGVIGIAGKIYLAHLKKRTDDIRDRINKNDPPQLGTDNENEGGQ